METSIPIDNLIPLALLKRIEALAKAESRPAADILREAIEGYLHERRARPRSERLTPQAAGERIRELRKGNALPEGETIESLIDFGRA